MSSSSMSPTVKQGETVRVDYTSYTVASPNRFDVVAFEPAGFPNQVWLMRVVGLPGESIYLTNGVVIIDGATMPIPVPNVTYVALGQFAITSPFTVPKDSYFVLGDSSTNANDSRFWGALPRTNILGKVKNR